MEKSKWGLFIKKTITALFLVPLTIAIIYLGYPLLDIALLAVGAVLSWEWAKMVPNKKPEVYAVIYAFSMMVSVMIGIWAAIWGVMIVASLLVWFKSKGEERRGLLTLGVPYISVGIGSLMWLYSGSYADGFFIILWLLIMVWSMDIGGYIVGCSVKGPKLAPKISPNKTWSGFIGGIALTNLTSAALFYSLGVDIDYVIICSLATGVAVLAQIGDLVESHIKRRIGVKDSSDLIPGHGGIFDRIDALIFAAPFVFLFFRYSYLLLD